MADESKGSLVGEAGATPDEKAAVRAAVFGQLAGLVVAPTVKALWDRRVFELLAASGGATLDQLCRETHANRGYLHVALRLLCSCGWLRQKNHGQTANSPYSLSDDGKAALEIAPRLYGEVLSFLPMAVFLEDFLFSKAQRSLPPSLPVLVPRAIEQWGMVSENDPVLTRVQEQVRKHLDGVLIGPAMVALARGGVFEQLEGGPVELKNIAANQTCLSSLFDLLGTQGWVFRDSNRVGLTPCGRYAAQIANAFGVTVSYLPLFTVVSSLLFGNGRIPRTDESGSELFVNRAINVWGSGGAHKTYFKKLEEIVIEIFNRHIESQPRGICDMGCGDGTLLEHLYSVVKHRTARGEMLGKHPLALLGADFNKVARRISTQKLRKAGIPVFHVIPGDINRPAQLASDLERLGHDIHDLLHVRSFLDHNRPYLPPAEYVRGTRTAKSTGAFAHLGEEIPADELEENLVRHLRRWAPYVGRFGLLALELHTLPPELTAANLDKTPAVAYDGTHGFSDQYLVELPVFLERAREAGLVAHERYQAKFPASELATISMNYFTAS